jgi:hypothetical protein
MHIYNACHNLDLLWSILNIAAKDCDEGADELPKMSEQGTPGCS